MKKFKFHIWLSLILYVACLTQAGFYYGNIYKEISAIEAFGIGWLGPLAGHLSWGANPIYFAAIATHETPKVSSMLAFAALILAISFIFMRSIYFNEGGVAHEEIVAYGTGYGLWIASLATLAIGQIKLTLNRSTKKIIFHPIATAALIITIYFVYNFTFENSPHSINSKRQYEMESRCANANELMFKKAKETEGIFFKPDLDLSTTQIRGQSLAMHPMNSTAEYFLDNGYLNFYEVENKFDDIGYYKHLNKSKAIKSNSLDSQHSVSTKFDTTPPFLNIFSATVQIIDLSNNSLVASSTFVVDEQTGKVCGKIRNEFPIVSFIQEALGLTQKYPMQATEKGNKPLIKWK